MVSRSSEISTKPLRPLSKLMSEFLTVFSNLLYLDISYINTIFNGF